MNKTSYPTATPVQLSAAFWPLFMTSKVMVRFVGAYICFGVADIRNQLLIVYAQDQAHSTHPPTPDSIRRAFPLHNSGQRTYTDPHELPVKYSDIGSIRSVQSYEFKQKSRRVVLLMQSGQGIQATDAEQLIFAQWARPDVRQIARLVDTIGADQVHIIEKNTREMRVLVRLRVDEQLDFLATGMYYRGEFGISSLLPISCESRTA